MWRSRTRVTASGAVPRHSGVGSQDTAAAMVQGARRDRAGCAAAGMTGIVNAANIIAALFVATGQDIACVHESGVSIFGGVGRRRPDRPPSCCQPRHRSVGGGTALPHQREWLTALGCAGSSAAAGRRDRRRFSRSRSTCPPRRRWSAGSSRTAHGGWGRARRVELVGGRTSTRPLRGPLAYLWRSRTPVTDVALTSALPGDGISSELGALGERRKLTCCSMTCA